jgi:hypothetical protein
MAKVFIEETTLTAIGDAIRGKTGKTELIDPANMSTEIASIEAGGGPEIPDSVFNLTGKINYRFAENGWNWFLRDYGHKITTKDITSMQYTFANNSRPEIPFQINVKDITQFDYAFQSADLTVCPKIRGTIKWASTTSFTEVISSTASLRDVEDLFDPEMFTGYSTYATTSMYSWPQLPKFNNMYSLRRVPSWWYKLRLNPENTVYPATSYTPYYGTFTGCYSLDELRDVPVWRCRGSATSNMFNSTFSYCARLKAITFETNADGSPIETQWKNQTIDLAGGVGYSTSTNTSYFTSYNSGITEDNKVTNDTNYQALKNDPNWFTCNTTYSRYNHDSAVETINSLPNTSAYLASAGGTNTIKFKKLAGSATDGGAIQNLTAEEIAVATAKGWTVTLA